MMKLTTLGFISGGILLLTAIHLCAKVSWENVLNNTCWQWNDTSLPTRKRYLALFVIDAIRDLWFSALILLIQISGSSFKSGNTAILSTPSNNLFTPTTLCFFNSCKSQTCSSSDRMVFGISASFHLDHCVNASPLRGCTCDLFSLRSYT